MRLQEHLRKLLAPSLRGRQGKRRAMDHKCGWVSIHPCMSRSACTCPTGKSWALQAGCNLKDLKVDLCSCGFSQVPPREWPAYNKMLVTGMQMGFHWEKVDHQSSLLFRYVNSGSPEGGDFLFLCAPAHRYWSTVSWDVQSMPGPQDQRHGEQAELETRMECELTGGSIKGTRHLKKKILS